MAVGGTQPTKQAAKQIDVEQLDEAGLRDLVKKLALEVEAQRQEIGRLRRMLFGSRSEKSRFLPGQDLLPFVEFNELKVEAAQAAAAVKPIEIKPHTRQPNQRRSEFPAHLPRERVEYALTEAERSCPECQQLRAEIGEDTTQELERLELCFVREIAQKKYACRHCQGHVTKAEAPARVLDKCLLGPGFLAQVAFDRFANHLPYARLERKYAVEGVDLSRSVLCSSMAKLAELLRPIFLRHMQDVLGALTRSVLQIDDTEVVQRNGQRPGSQKVHVWALRDQDGGVFFRASEARSQAAVNELLPGRSGLLQGDGHGCYDALPETLVLLGCWSHARRDFESALRNGNELARQPFEWINQLFASERVAKSEGIAADEARLLAWRQEHAVPILHALRTWLDETRLKPPDLPKSQLMSAVGYCLNQWPKLSRFAANGRVREISNNACERALRNVVLGRNNWLFFGNEDGTDASLLLLSLIQSCRELGVNPLVYLGDVMRRVRTTSSDELAALTPRGWSGAAGRDEKVAAARRELGELVGRLHFQS